MKHFEFCKDTFARMGMAASEEAFDVLSEMEFMLDDLKMYQWIDHKLENKDLEGLCVLHAIMGVGANNWVDEKYGLDHMKENIEEISEVLQECMKLICVFFDLDYKPDDEKGFRLEYRD